jgi:hypothetical protein
MTVPNINRLMWMDFEENRFIILGRNGMDIDAMAIAMNVNIPQKIMLHFYFSFCHKA